ncbi:MAG: hypothetical protein FWB86_12135 [Treponema sp.]|nr:hypothetical protein [Treponema sp.]MCL2252569.1 hypothetical protein [Treponema sp.]
MKKMLFFAFFWFMFISLINAQTLDEAILAAAIKMGRDLPANTKVSVINFTSPSENLNKYVIDELNGNILRNRRILPVILEQDQLQNLQSDLNKDDLLNTESIQNIGQLLGIEYIITGSLELVDIEYKFLLNAVDTVNAEIKSQYTASINFRNDQKLSSLLRGGAPLRLSSSSRQSSGKLANVKNNWISANLNVIGIGLTYERMLTPKLSLGGNIYYLVTNLLPQFFADGEYSYDEVGVDLTFRFYPWGKTFFIGLSLGYHSASIYYGYIGWQEITESFLGIAISPEIGWKIDTGNPGGFFLETCIKIPISGRITPELFIPFPYIGLGWAF